MLKSEVIMTVKEQPCQTKAVQHTQQASPLTFSVGQTLDEVMDAWALVYDAYRRLGLIEPNAWGVHCTPHVFTNDTAVIRGCLEDRCVTTLTGYLDHPDHGLPLDAAYPDTLARLRDQGCELIEIGLLADRREDMRRTRSSLMELMRWGTYFGLTHGARQAVIGVHPHHAKFYAKCLGFEMIGSEKSYGAVNGAPVVPLFLDWHRYQDQGKIPKGLRNFMSNALNADQFAERKTWPNQPSASVNKGLDSLLLGALSTLQAA